MGKFFSQAIVGVRKVVVCREWTNRLHVHLVCKSGIDWLQRKVLSELFIGNPHSLNLCAFNKLYNELGKRESRKRLRKGRKKWNQSLRQTLESSIGCVSVPQGHWIAAEIVLESKQNLPADERRGKSGNAGLCCGLFSPSLTSTSVVNNTVFRVFRATVC